MKFAAYTEAFIQERRIFKDVSPATLEWYKYSLRAFQPVLDAELDPPQIKSAVMQQIETLRAGGRGNKAVSVNTYLRCLKAFFNWCHAVDAGQGQRVRTISDYRFRV
jgi:site-specific recombinase XerD